MFVICDQIDRVQDIATEKANLSRGYNYPGYKLWPDAKAGDIQIGDTFKDGVFTKNQAKRNERLQHQQNEQKVQDKIRAMAIGQLIKEGALPAEYK